MVRLALGGLLAATAFYNFVFAWSAALRRQDFAFSQHLHGGLRVVERAQGIGEGKINRRAGGSQHIKYHPAKGTYYVKYGFKAFDGKIHRLSVLLAEEPVNSSAQEFGLPDRKLKSINRWYERAQQQAIDAGGFDVDMKLERIHRRYRNKRKQAYHNAFFRFVDKETIEVDVPRLVRHNMKRLTPVARKLHRITKPHNYGTEELSGSVLAMVQTAMAYEIPESNFGGRTLSGMLPPPQAFVLGRGDCDTKSALLSTILMNWPRIKMVGVSIPGHYLAAVHWIPRRGDVYVEHKGLPYILLEPAGPAWIAPGQVGELTENYLNSGRALSIDPIQI